MARRFVQIIIACGMIFPFFGIAPEGSEIPTTIRIWAALLWVLCLSPLLLYVSRDPQSRRPIPFIEGVSLLYGLYFALPVVLGDVRGGGKITTITVNNLENPLELVSFGVIGLLTTYYTVVNFDLTSYRRNSGQSQGWFIAPASARQWGLILILGGVTAGFVTTVFNVPNAFNRLAKFCYQLSWIGIGIFVVLAVNNRLGKINRKILYISVFVLFLIRLNTGLAYSILEFLTVVFLILWIVRRTISWRFLIAGIAALLFVIAVRNVIPQYRKAVWYGGSNSIFQRTEVMTNLLQKSVGNRGIQESITKGATDISSRSQIMATFADVVARTPKRIPYWRGKTYYSLLGAFTPAFIWPGQPKASSGQAFGHRYGYLDPWDTSTSKNLPHIIEFYANFGYSAVIIGMCIIGLIYGIIRRYINRAGQNILTSLVGVVIYVPLLRIENSFSLVFGGLILTFLSIFVFLKAAKLYPFPLGRPDN